MPNLLQMKFQCSNFATATITRLIEVEGLDAVPFMDPQAVNGKTAELGDVVETMYDIEVAANELTREITT